MNLKLFAFFEFLSNPNYAETETDILKEGLLVEGMIPITNYELH